MIIRASESGDCVMGGDNRFCRLAVLILLANFLSAGRGGLLAKASEERLVPFQLFVPTFSLHSITALVTKAGCSNSAYQVGTALGIPDYRGWELEEEATTYRPGTDLQFYAVELKSYVNPEDPADKVVELRRADVLYILYYYTFTKDKARWEIYMDAGFADAPCGFFDPAGKPTGRYVRIDLACLRDTERVDLRSSQ